MRLHEGQMKLTAVLAADVRLVAHGTHPEPAVALTHVFSRCLGV